MTGLEWNGVEMKATRADGVRRWVAHQYGNYSHSCEIEVDMVLESTMNEGKGP